MRGRWRRWEVRTGHRNTLGISSNWNHNIILRWTSFLDPSLGFSKPSHMGSFWGMSVVATVHPSSVHVALTSILGSLGSAQIKPPTDKLRILDLRAKGGKKEELNQIPTTELKKKKWLVHPQGRGKGAICPLITYDSAFYHSKLTILKSLWDGCSFCSKGMPSQGGGFWKRWVGEPCLCTAACYGCLFMIIIFHPTGSKLIYLFPKRSKGKPLRLLLISTGNLERKENQRGNQDTYNKGEFEVHHFRKGKLNFSWVGWEGRWAG